MIHVDVYPQLDSISPKLKFGYQYIDEGEGFPIVLLHGLFGSLSNWENVIEHYRFSNRVLVPILPIQDTTFLDVSLDNLVDYIHGFYKKVGLKKTILMGNSMGGQLAILFALKFPELVDKLILTGSAGLYENTMGTNFPKRGDISFISEKVKMTFYSPEVASQKLISEVYEVTKSVPKSLRIVRFARLSQKLNLSDQLKFIKIPTLIIWGENDVITPIDVAYKFNQLISGSTLRIISECGHVPMMEQPYLFNSYVDGFSTLR